MLILDNIDLPYYPLGDETASWYNIDDEWKNQEFISILMPLAGHMFPTERAVGYEIWEKDTDSPEHIDKDEELIRTTGILSTPICSIIYYYEVSHLKGGELVSPNNWTVTPKKNRLVIFAPHTSHLVPEFTGTRKAVHVNPWSSPLGSPPASIGDV